MDCYFCQKNVKEIDFKNAELLKKFISGLGKIKARKSNLGKFEPICFA